MVCSSLFRKGRDKLTDLDTLYGNICFRSVTPLRSLKADFRSLHEHTKLGLTSAAIAKESVVTSHKAWSLLLGHGKTKAGRKEGEGSKNSIKSTGIKKEKFKIRYSQ